MNDDPMIPQSWRMEQQIADLTSERARLQAERDHYHRFATMVGEIVRMIAEDVPSIDIEVLLQDLPTIVANIRTERDRFRVAAERAREQTQDEVLSHTKTATELDRLRAILNADRTDISGGYTVDECVRYEATIAHVIAERDKWRAVVDAWAGDGVEYRHALGHIMDCAEGCEQCRDLARSTLDLTTMGKAEGT